VYTLRSERAYWIAVGLTGTCGAVASLLSLRLGQWIARIAGNRSSERLSLGALVSLVATVSATSGPPGLVILLTATGIGLLPAVLGSRRMNCLGILLLPMLLDATGSTPLVAHWLGFG
jgi:putative membrane protein